MAKKEKAPAFQFYPKDWLSDVNVMAMTSSQRGVYIHLLALMWLDHNCSLPAQLPILMALSNGSENDVAIVLNCFEKSEEKIFSSRLISERKKQKKFLKQSSEAGKRSAALRKAKVKVGCDSVDDTLQPKSNSSSSSSSSSSNNIKDIKERADEFKLQVLIYRNDYPVEMLKAFFEYWTEHSPNAKKMRFEKQDAFDMKRRLTTWSNNEKKKSSCQKEKPRSATEASLERLSELHGIYEREENQ